MTNLGAASATPARARQRAARAGRSWAFAIGYLSPLSMCGGCGEQEREREGRVSCGRTGLALIAWGVSYSWSEMHAAEIAGVVS